MCHGLRVSVQHWASPFTALRGVGGRTIDVGSYGYSGDGAGAPLWEGRGFLVVHPGWEAGEWVVAQGGMVGGAPIVAVILADSVLEGCLLRGLGGPPAPIPLGDRGKLRYLRDREESC